MSTSTKSSTDSAQADPTQSYAPYAQLVKMLVPSSGCIALYDIEGDLIWCSDGYERPDLRELVEDLRAESQRAAGSRPGMHTTTTGVTAYAAVLDDGDGHPIGCVIIELNQGTSSGSAVAQSLLRPVLECLQTRLQLDRVVAEGGESREDGFDLLLSLDDQQCDGASALLTLVEHCVENLGCIGGAFVIPEKNLSFVVGLGGQADDDGRHLLDRTQKHLLAWAQLNNRPMVVNRVGGQADQAPYKILSCPVRDAEQRVTGLLALFRAASADNFEIRDVRILEFMSRKAMSILSSEHDPLTGLVHRIIFERRVQKVLDTSPAEEHALLYVDIDRLQLINDAFGYQAGDEVIERLAEVIRTQLASDDIATRVGGDRFALFLPGKPATRANQIARQILSAMSQLGYVNGSEAVPVSVSLGLATPAAGTEEIRHLLAAAELACKQAKRLGCNRIETCSDSSLTALMRRDELFASASLQQALKNNEFRLEAQPIVGIAADVGRVLGYEVLVRMRDASGQLVAPDKFVAAAERYGLMPALDKWVVSATIRALSDSPALIENLPLGVSINIAAQTLLGQSFAELVIEELREAGLSPASFCFEINESAAINHISEAQRVIETFERAGCAVALDDFGHALSSLAHLKRLRVRYLKIDGSLVRRLLDDIHAESMVRGLSRAAQTLGVKLVAEHVESEQVAARLAELEIDFGQGFHYGHPQPLLRALGEPRAPRQLAAKLG